MARYVMPDMSPWRHRPLTIPPDSWLAWLHLAVWEFWMGVLLCAALLFGGQLIATAPQHIVTVSGVSNCNMALPPFDCEPVVFRGGLLSVVFDLWLAVLLIAVAVWLIWELWIAVAPAPITDEFLKLLDDSFGRDWRHLRTWPWARLGWAYGFTLVGAGAALAITLVGSDVVSHAARAPVPRVETSQQFQLMR